MSVDVRVGSTLTSTRGATAVTECQATFFVHVEKHKYMQFLDNSYNKCKKLEH